jgi:phospholipid/cholesterol/gamma-HCH transport system substrate-binding protein
MIARVAAVSALVGAIVLVALILFGGGPGYTLTGEFQDAGGLVPGNLVMIGPAQVGSVQSVGLGPNGEADVKFSVDSNVAPIHQGTVARIYENSLSGIANHYIVLEPSSPDAPAIRNGGVIGEDHTYSFVNLDQLFDTLGPKTRQGLRGFIQGEAASIEGRAPQAHKTLQYFAPALQSTSNVTQELTSSEPEFDALLVQGAKALSTLATRTGQLTQLVANTNRATGAIASQSKSLEQALSQLAPALNHSTSTFAGLRSELDALDPLVTASIPASRQLAPFAAALGKFTRASIPTVGSLAALIRNPSGGGDLISLLQATPSLNRLAQASFPRMIKEFNDSQPQVDTFREYTPDVVAALTNLGQTGGYFDANGHYARTQPFFGAFGVDASNQLTDKPASERFAGLEVARSRCPGSASQPTADGSSPWLVPGCSNLTVPPGP